MKKTLICLLCLVSVAAFAKGYSPAATARAGGYDVKFASNGTPIAVPASNVPGGVGATAASKITLPGGVDFPFTATSVIATGAMFTPWGSAIGIAIAAGSIGVAILDQILAQQKIRVKPGGGSLEQSDPAVCSTAPCTYYIAGQSEGSTLNGTCAAEVARLQTTDRTATYTYLDATSIGPDYGKCYGSFRMNDGSYQSGRVEFVNWVSGTRAASPASYIPISVAAATKALAERSPSAAEVQALVDLGFPPELAPPVMTGPASVSKQNIVQLGLDGKTIIEIEERYIASFNPGIIGIGVATTTKTSTPASTSNVTTTNADGSVSTAVVVTPATTSTFTGSTTAFIPPAAPAEVPVTCGLPGTPACRLDESGTATGANQTFDPTKTAIDAAKVSAETNIAGAASIGAPAWSFAFQLPTGCAPYVTGIKGVVLNVCQYQSTIHGLLSAIWAAATAFAMIGMVGRTIRES